MMRSLFVVTPKTLVSNLVDNTCNIAHLLPAWNEEMVGFLAQGILREETCLIY